MMTPVTGSAGYDTDTVAAVYAGLAGAFYGFEDVPPRWIKALNGSEHVERVTAAFVTATQALAI